MMCKEIEKTINFNGAALAIRKHAIKNKLDGGFNSVIIEDVELAFRCFNNGLKVKYASDVRVKVDADLSIRQWFKQRKRWAVGFGELLRIHWRTLWSFIKQHPKFSVKLLLYIAPGLPVVFLWVLSILLSPFLSVFEHIVNFSSILSIINNPYFTQ